jgi:S-DNA-T family DNA segregation ATPase FtsK/SpoIIIE
VVLIVFGAAGFLLPIGLLWVGTAYTFLSAHFSKRTFMGLFFFVFAGSCMLGVTGFLSDWAVRNHIMYPGGFAGYFVGTKALKALLNTTGSMILLVVVYLIGMIMLTGINPIFFTKKCYNSTKEWIETKRRARVRSTERKMKRVANDSEKQSRTDERNKAKEAQRSKERRGEAKKGRGGEKEPPSRNGFEGDSKTSNHRFFST